MNTDALLTVLRPALADLTADLAIRAEDPGVASTLAAEWQAEVDARRTADPLPVWLDERVGQIAAAWLLSVLFVRTLEDRGLCPPRLKGGDDSRDAFRRLFPYLTDRDYLLAVFRGLTHQPSVRDVFDADHNPVWTLAPSAEAAGRLLDRATDATDGMAAFDMSGDTRFLGDVYEQLNEEVRKRYALLQTPDFVEDYLLTYTLDPALEARGTDVTLIDPTCGSGHLLLGGFRRLLHAKRAADPSAPTDVLAYQAIHQVYGTDLNPYALAIARFRLVLAYLDALGATSLTQGQDLRLNVAVADSLLPPEGDAQQQLGAEGDAQQRLRWNVNPFALRQEAQVARVLGRRFDVVVGNPPYITPKDAVLREEYRARYASAYREYQLVVPFVERFFGLANEAGWVGAIVGNGFMKREFGKKLIEEFLPTVDLTHVVDTSGAYIPGHGTPTVILFGRNRRPTAQDIPCVMGKRGEPSTPRVPSDGLVWSSIREHTGVIGFEDEFASFELVPRDTLSVHPWSLKGGGASEVLQQVEAFEVAKLSELWEETGYAAISGEDNVFMLPFGALARHGVRNKIALIAGVHVRDWQIESTTEMAWPNHLDGEDKPIEEIHDVLRYFWPYRECLRNRKAFGVPIEERGIDWWKVREVYKSRFKTPLTIVFAFVATHNHFVLSRVARAFNRSAPIIKLPAHAGEDDHLGLLGYLNSSTACFWMKQVSHDKGSGTDKGKWQDDPAKIAYEFTGTRLEQMPVPDISTVKPRLLALATSLDADAHARHALLPATFIRGEEHFVDKSSLLASLARVEAEEARLLERAIALQEELDWTVYTLFGFADVSTLADPPFDNLRTPLGARPFEVAAAREGESVGTDGQPLFADLDRRVSVDLARIYETRVAKTASSKALSLLEDPRWKRRWLITPKHLAGTVLTFEHRLQDALRTYLLDALESAITPLSTPTSLATLAHTLSQDPKVLAVAQVLTDHDDPDLTALLTDLALSDAVPFLPAWTFKPSGMKKRAAWEKTWDAQRREDAGEKVKVPLPPKYGSGDFLQSTYWSLRGKLDVPKERFILYPDCHTESDPTAVIAWAGWNHLQRMEGLYSLYKRLKGERDPEDLLPLLAGLHELVPWVKQWHGEDVDGLGSPGDDWADMVETTLTDAGVDLDTLRAWRPPSRSRGSRARSKA